MHRTSLIEQLGSHGISSQAAYMSQAFSRNIGLFSQKEQEKLAAATIGIPGMGGVGGGHFMTMVRTGVCRFHVSDFDIYEPANVNRQFGARVPDFGRPKMAVMKEQALSVNPFIEVNTFAGGISPKNIDAFLDGVDVVIDSLDFFAFDARRLLFTRARQKDIHVITAGPLGFSAAMLVFAPDKGMGFDAYFNIVENMTPEEQSLAFALGLAPKATQFSYMDTSKVSFKSEKGPSLYIACQLCCAMAGTEAVRILLGRGRVKPVPYYVQFDPYVRKYYCRKLPMGNKNPLQKFKAVVVRHMLDKNTPITPEEPPKPSLTIANNAIDARTMAHIIQAGIQAPSGDNAQPWQFSYEKNTIKIYLNEDADHSFFNVSQIASIISCGAAVENMKIAATAFQLQADIRYTVSRQGPIRTMASLTLSPDIHLTEDPLAHCIWNRQTNRKLYKKVPPSPGQLTELKSLINELPGTGVVFITDPVKLKQLARMVSRADSIRTQRKDLHEHLFEMIRFSKKEVFEKKDGFYIKNLEAGKGGELFLTATRSWPAMNIANKLGLGKMVAKAAFDGIVNASGAALVLTDGRTDEHFLKGGRALERIWLGLTRAGFHVQPMTAITLFFMRRQLKGDMDFSEPHVRLLDTIQEGYQDLFSEVDLGQKGQVMLLRFGKAADIKYGTLRKDQNRLIYDGSG